MSASDRRFAMGLHAVAVVLAFAGAKCGELSGRVRRGLREPRQDRAAACGVRIDSYAEIRVRKYAWL